MKRLIVTRHGKAAVSSETGLDADRPLTGLGHGQARWLAERFSDAVAMDGLPPTRVLVSPAVRTRETAEPILAALGLDAVIDERLFIDEPVGPVIDLIADLLSGEDDCVCVVGHNPQVSYLVGTVCGGPMGACASMRTGEAAVLGFDPDEPAGGGRELMRLRFDG